MFVFSDERADFNLEKRNFPENTLCYIDQGYIFTVNESELAILQPRIHDGHSQSTKGH